jgi:hypothetical protein
LAVPHCGRYEAADLAGITAAEMIRERRLDQLMPDIA